MSGNDGGGTRRADPLGFVREVQRDDERIGADRAQDDDGVRHQRGSGAAAVVLQHTEVKYDGGWFGGVACGRFCRGTAGFWVVVGVDLRWGLGGCIVF